MMAIVHNHPIAEGHMLIFPKQERAKLQDLTEQEAIDMFILANKFQKVLESVFDKPFSLCIENGPNAGQTNKQVSIQLLPKTEQFSGKFRTDVPQDKEFLSEVQVLGLVKRIQQSFESFRDSSSQ